jgi:hypothetical protein
LNSALKHSIIKAQRNQERLELNGTRPVSVYADDVNLLGGNINAIKKIQNSD